MPKRNCYQPRLCCVNNVFKKIEPRIFCIITFFKFRSTENKNFLENPHKEVNVTSSDILFCPACFFFVLKPSFVVGGGGGGVSKNSHIL